MSYEHEIDPVWKEQDPSEFLKNCKKEVVDFIPFGGSSVPNSQDYSAEIEALTKRVESLERLIKSIFDGHVLIDGKFVDVRRITEPVITG
jgi:hypothetical protein